jgi:PAS domain S-box-containing protein
MAHTIPYRVQCSFKQSAWLDPWLTVIPCRSEAGVLTWRRAGIVESYLTAVAMVAVATAVRVAVDPYIYGAQFFTFCFAVILSTFVGGGCVGLLSVVLSTLSAWFFLLPPYSFHLISGEAAALAAFLIVGSIIVSIVGSLQAAAITIADGQANAAVLEERLRATEELRRWGDVFRHTAIGVTLNDPKNNTVILGNPAFEAMFRISSDEVFGMPASELAAPSDRQRLPEIRAISDRDGHVDYEADCIRKDGSIFPARINLTSVRGDNGELRYRILTGQDITKERQLEAARVRATEELRRWYDTFQHISIGVALNDPKSNTLIIANPACTAMHRIPMNEIVGMSVFDLYTPAERQRIDELKVTSDRYGQVDYEADCLRKDGSIFPARIHNTSVRAQNDELLYRIVTIQDITKERQLEAELRQAQRLEAIGQLSAGVAHDFNNILQAIMSNLELVEDDVGVPPATAEKVGTAVRLAEEGAELTQQLLSFARKQALRPHRIDLGSFLEDFRSMMVRSLDPRITIDLAVESGISVWADKSHLWNALMNLAINARDAMPAGGNLRIEASACPTAATRELVEGSPEESAVLRLTDTGTGIPPEHLSRVCDPFFSTKGLNGTGLGLSMVHGFAQQSGGALRINSEVGKGTCVALWLPLAPTPSDIPIEVAPGGHSV